MPSIFKKVFLKLKNFFKDEDSEAISIKFPMYTFCYTDACYKQEFKLTVSVCFLRF